MQDTERLNPKLTILGQMARNIEEMTMLNYKLPQKDSCSHSRELSYHIAEMVPKLLCAFNSSLT